MNSLFRNIKENRNLDSMEESDDEDDFQDTRIDKHVDLNKKILIECIFNSKFKSWVPVRMVEQVGGNLHNSDRRMNLERAVASAKRGEGERLNSVGASRRSSYGKMVHISKLVQ